MNSDDASDQQQPNQAADLIRQKIDALYTSEPNARTELIEAEAVIKQPRSKHQQFIHELNQSGKSMAEIQQAWHGYYIGLPDHEKHEVWQEFYAEAKKSEAVQSVVAAAEVHPPQQSAPLEPSPRPKPKKLASHMPKHKISEPRSVAAIKHQLISKVQSREKVSRSSHVRSIAFGLGLGAVVVIILLFSFFNERIIAPFITPSRTVSSTPIITSQTDPAVGPEPKIIIPKINVEIPVVYNEPSIEEAAVQKALESGVLHYATTPDPGQTGNGVIFGHSSNNILNPGKYKFAFVLLSRMEVGDTFMLQKDSKRYVYRVFDKKIVAPADVSVLGSADRPSTMTLITCDPPGTTLKRLVVLGEQISPDPANNIASAINEQSATQPQKLPSDAPSLWQRVVDWFTG